MRGFYSLKTWELIPRFLLSLVEIIFEWFDNKYPSPKEDFLEAGFWQ